VGNDVVDQSCFDVASLLDVVKISFVGPFEAFVAAVAVVVVALTSMRREV